MCGITLDYGTNTPESIKEMGDTLGSGKIIIYFSKDTFSNIFAHQSSDYHNPYHITEIKELDFEGIYTGIVNGGNLNKLKKDKFDIGRLGVCYNYINQPGSTLSDEPVTFMQLRISNIDEDNRYSSSILKPINSIHSILKENPNLIIYLTKSNFKGISYRPNGFVK